MNSILDFFCVSNFTAYSAAVSAVFAAVSACFAYRSTHRSRKEQLEKDLHDILKTALKYPYLECKEFTSSWCENRTSDEERFLRYDVFCNIVFNFLYRVYNYYKGDRRKIENFVDVQNWVKLHRQNWENPAEKGEYEKAYSPGFKDFINYYLSEQEMLSPECEKKLEC